MADFQRVAPVALFAGDAVSQQEVRQQGNVEPERILDAVVIAAMLRPSKGREFRIPLEVLDPSSK